MKTRLLILLVFSLCTISCNKLHQLTQFTVTDQFETKISAGLATMLPTDIATPPVSSNAEKELSANNSHASMIESAKLKAMDLTITDPIGVNFDFLKDLELFISADGLPEQRIAYVFDVPDTIGNSLPLNCENVELQAYIKKGTYTVRMRVTTDKILNKDITIKVNSKFRIDAKILGL